MSFVPNTDAEKLEMLKTIGVNSFDELIGNIPDDLKFKGKLNLPETLSEFEVLKMMEEYAKMNVTAESHICYTGGGAYDHFIPSIVGYVLQKSEFKTAYTPYQAEVSQGTLQVMYEFQTMVCQLTGMDVANASLYDGGSALAEACLLANAHNRGTEFVFAGTINPRYIETVKTIASGKNFTFKECVNPDGTCDIDSLKAALNDKTAAVIVQHPNFYGTLEDVFDIESVVHANSKALFVTSINVISLGMLEAPGSYNADIVVGEGQMLGIPLSFGGPFLGLFACKQELVRKIPGRLSGMTLDQDGQRAFVLTLQTREQQIKREKATSNICTNQGLFMLAATVYMSTMGRAGIKEVAENSFNGAHYLASKISAIPGFSLAVDKPFFNEFVISAPVDASVIVEEAEKIGILAGLNLARFKTPVNGLMIAVTEKRTKEDLDRFAWFLNRFSK